MKNRSKSQPARYVAEEHVGSRSGSPEFVIFSETPKKKKLRKKKRTRGLSPALSSRPPWNGDLIDTTTVREDEEEEGKFLTNNKFMVRSKTSSQREQDDLNNSWMSTLRAEVDGRPEWNSDTTIDNQKEDKVDEYGRIKRSAPLSLPKSNIKEQEDLNDQWMSSLRGELVDRPAWNSDTAIEGYDNVDEFGKVKRIGMGMSLPSKTNTKQQDELNEKWMSSLRDSFHD